MGGAGRQPGAPSLADAAKTRANAQTGAVSTSRRYQWQMPLDSASASNEYPIVPTPHDPYDDIANVKEQYATARGPGGTDTNWVVTFDDSDAQYSLRKRDAQEKAEFDAWVMQKYDITDPAQNLMLQNIAPELFQRREEIIESQQALVSAYAKARLRGAKNLSDLELQWLIETGRLELPKGPIWQPKMWREAQTGTADVAQDQTWQRERYRFGLFSPLQWLTESNGGRTPGRNRADIAGSNTVYNSTGVPYPNDSWANEWGPPIPYPYAGSNTHGARAAAANTRYAAEAVTGQRDLRGTGNAYRSQNIAPGAAP